MRVLGITGSLRRHSYNRQLLSAAELNLPSGATLEVFDHLHRIPPFSEDDQPTESVAALRSRITVADAVLIATPEYNASIPGVLKNALDWASRPHPDHVLRHKPVAVVGASTGMFGAVWAQAEVRKVLDTVGAHVLGRELPVGGAHEAFAPDGNLADPQLRSTLHDLVRDVLTEATNPAELAGSAARSMDGR